MFKSHCAILHGFVLLKRLPLVQGEDDANKWKTPWDGERGQRGEELDEWHIITEMQDALLAQQYRQLIIMVY